MTEHANEPLRLLDPALTTQPAILTFDLDSEHFNEDAWRALFGQPPRSAVLPPDSTFSVAYETTEKVSGEPAPPQRRRGFWAWLTRANRKAEAAYRAEFDAWWDAGCPDQERTVRHYFPRVHLERTPEPDPHAEWQRMARAYDVLSQLGAPS